MTSKYIPQLANQKLVGNYQYFRLLYWWLFQVALKKNWTHHMDFTINSKIKIDIINGNRSALEKLKWKGKVPQGKKKKNMFKHSSKSSKPDPKVITVSKWNVKR